MNRDFEIVDGIYLVQAGRKLDLHNNFDFTKLYYSVQERKLILNWQRSKGVWEKGVWEKGEWAKGDGVNADIPLALSIEFKEVSEFRFMPRDPALPFSEDDCVSTFGYWLDEDWAGGVIVLGADQKTEPHWLTAIDFMSGAVLAVQAASASAKVQV